MARSTIEVPYDVTFPAVCAGCTAAATKTLRMQVQKPSASRSWAWFFFGILGWLVVGGASKDAFIRYEVPYCENCHRQARLFQTLIWILVILLVVVLCGGSALVSSLPRESSDLSDALGILIALAVVFGGIAITVLAIIASSRRAVVIQRINERLQSLRMGFLNPSYFDLFRQENLDRLVAFGLRANKMEQIPLDEAVAVISRQIDPDNPRSAASLKGYFERGQLYLQQHAYDQAVADLNRVIEVTGFQNPYFLEAQYFRGQAHMLSGNPMQAQIDLENYLKAASDKARIRQARQWLKQIGKG